jgi:cell shape-determining protein MreC
MLNELLSCRKSFYFKATVFFVIISSVSSFADGSMPSCESQLQATQIQVEDVRSVMISGIASVSNGRALVYEAYQKVSLENTSLRRQVAEMEVKLAGLSKEKTK